MINKIYDNIRQTIKENYKIIISFIILMILFTVEFPYYIEAPGGIIAINDRIEMTEKTESSGTFNLAYVSSIQATIPTLLYAAIDKDWDIFKKEEVIYENETVEDEEYRNRLLLNEANNNAIIVAFQHANKEITISNEHLFITYVDITAKTDLKIGDEILEVDGEKIVNKEQLDTIIETKQAGTKVLIDVKREDKVIECYGILQEIEDKKIIGVMLSKTSDITTNPEVKFKFKQSESGPSGGLMMALSIYDALVEDDITYGKKIVGTGTIDLNGNVGSIGGVEYKIKGAVKEKADIFLVPSGDNYEAARNVIEENNYNLILIPVSNFKEALNKLSLLLDNEVWLLAYNSYSLILRGKRHNVFFLSF